MGLYILFALALSILFIAERVYAFHMRPIPNAWRSSNAMRSVAYMGAENRKYSSQNFDNLNKNDIIAAIPDIVSKAAATKSDKETGNVSADKGGIRFEDTSLNGTDVRVGIIMARWNDDIINGLYKGVNESLTECGVKSSNTFTTYVPGAFELPVTARLLAASKRVDVIICLGCLIKGDTMHFEYIAGAVSQGIMQVSIDSYIPCIFGVLTTLDKDQAIKRSTGKDNEGLSWGKSAVEMGLTRMSALGIAGRSLKSDDQTKPYWNLDNKNSVTKNGTEKAEDEDEDEGKKRRKIGF
jgi:6,7-dimethyl-8-ribityllumazine synthase